jgi:hypothetical protein
MTPHRSSVPALILAAALLVAPTGFTETDPQYAVVEGVLGTLVWVDGVPRQLQRSEQIPFGVNISAGAGTVVFLHETWETSRGRCVYWRVLNETPWSVASLKTQPDYCPVINTHLSLWDASRVPGRWDFSDVQSPPDPTPPPQAGGIPIADSRGLGQQRLGERLSSELDEIYQARGQTRPLPVPSPPGGLRTVRPSARGVAGWQPIPGSGSSAVSDAAVEYRDRLYVFAIGDRAHYMNDYDGASWNGWRPVPGGGAAVIADSSVVYRDRLYLFGIGVGDHAHYMNVFDGAGWTGWQPVPGGGTTDVTDAAVVHDDRLYLFSVGIADRAHYGNVFDGIRWTGWQVVPGGERTKLATTAASYNGRLYLFAVGPADGAFFVNSLADSGWSGWQPVFGGKTTNLAPLAVADGGGLYLFGIGANDRARYVNVFDGSQWTGWSLAADGITNVRDTAASYRGRLHLVGIGADDQRHYFRVLR